jgi:hypothetical protein
MAVFCGAPGKFCTRGNETGPVLAPGKLEDQDWSSLDVCAGTTLFRRRPRRLSYGKPADLETDGRVYREPKFPCTVPENARTGWWIAWTITSTFTTDTTKGTAWNVTGNFGSGMYGTKSYPSCDSAPAFSTTLY